MTQRDHKFGAVFGAAVAMFMGSSVLAHSIYYDFILLPQQVVPFSNSQAFGSGRIAYNHHTGLFRVDIRIWGITAADLLDVGPNGSPSYLFVGGMGENGTAIVDFSEFEASPWQDVEGGIHMFINSVFLGGEQGELNSDFELNDIAIQEERTYVQIFTSAWPGGELRGQVTERPHGPCWADRNTDGFVTGDDYDQFVLMFSVGDPLADFNLDGFVTGDDFDQFVTAYLLGC